MSVLRKSRKYKLTVIATLHSTFSGEEETIDHLLFRVIASWIACGWNDFVVLSAFIRFDLVEMWLDQNNINLISIQHVNIKPCLYERELNVHDKWFTVSKCIQLVSPEVSKTHQFQVFNDSKWVEFVWMWLTFVLPILSLWQLYSSVFNVLRNDSALLKTELNIGWSVTNLENDIMMYYLLSNTKVCDIYKLLCYYQRISIIFRVDQVKSYWTERINIMEWIFMVEQININLKFNTVVSKLKRIIQSRFI